MEYNPYPIAPTSLLHSGMSSSHSGGAYSREGAWGHNAPLLQQQPSRSVSPPASSSIFTLRDPRAVAPVQTVAFGDGKLASAADNTILVWSLTDWRIWRTLSEPRRRTRFDLLCWDPRNLSSRLASAATVDRTLKLWDLKAKVEHQIEFQLSGTDDLTHIAWNPDDGNTIILGTAATLSVYDVRQNRVLSSRKCESPVNQFCFQQGNLLVGTDAGTVEFLDPATLVTRGTIWAHPSGVWSIAANTKVPLQFATGGTDALVEIWTNKSGTGGDLTCGATMDRHISRIETLTFSANGKWLASNSYREKVVDVCSAETGELLTSIAFDQNVASVCFDLNESSDVANLAFCAENSRDVYVHPITGQEAGQEQRPSSRLLH